METKEIRYDQKSDILHIWSERPENIEEITSEETGEEILIERNARTGEKVGVTIMHFSKRKDAAKGIDFSGEIPETA